MADFIDMNPSVASDCYGWVGGSKYCVLMPRARHISIDGNCGVGGNITCIGSSFGDCCGKDGKCGFTDDFCAIGNCQDGICPGLGYTTDGSCSKNHGYLRCGGLFGKCCSNAGKCGSTEAECGVANCQSGDCDGSTTSSSAVPAPMSTSALPLPSPFSPSPDGTCGGAMQYKCTGTELQYGNCCGARGYCGFSEWECSDTLGCQSDYGYCDVTITVIDGSTYTEPKTTSTSRVLTTKSATTTTATSQGVSNTASSTSAAATTSALSPAPTGPVFAPGVGNFALEGCLAEPDGQRALQNVKTDGNMTIETCLGFAQGYNYAGVEYGSECWYGNAVSGGSLLPTAAECNMPCQGNPLQYCGSGNRMILYKLRGYTPPASGPGIVPAVGAYQVRGCYAEPAGGRALSQLLDSADMTVEKCVVAASAAGAKYAGIEYGRECWYGNALSGGAFLPTTDNCVTMTCPGNPFQYCGSGSHLLLYSTS